MKIAIKICSPTPEHGGGDGPLARRLAHALELRGHACRIDTRQDWYRCGDNADAVIAIMGLAGYRPRPGQRSVLWVISHPELRTPVELESYDAVCIASAPFCETVRRDVRVPCHTLPQCTDPDLFALQGVEPDIDILFVGNNYYTHQRYRKVVGDLLAGGGDFDFRVVGEGWRGVVDDHRILAERVDYEQLPALYSRARINLNDHHEMMRRHGFINNRAYDLAALGCFQISDRVAGLDKLGIVSYSTPDELRRLCQRYLADASERRRNAEIVRRLCVGETFGQRAEVLEKILSGKF